MVDLLRHWSPAPVPRVSLWLHGAGAATLATAPLFGSSLPVSPAPWQPVLALLAANHLVLTALMHPRGRWLGANLVRLPDSLPDAVALTFDDGPDPEVTPRVLDLLDRHGAKASFFVIGRRAQRHPALLRDVVRRGHTVENHSQRHRMDFACRGLWLLRREVTEAQQAIAAATGVAPRFFRAPMGLRSPLLDPILADAGLCLAAWTRRGYDARRRDPARVLDRLARGLAGRDLLLLHDGNAARDAAGKPVVLSVLPALLDRIAAASLSAVSLAAVPTQPLAGSAGLAGAAIARPSGLAGG